MAMTPGNRDQNLPLSDINVTPLVDVMLVLLIIFMVTAPHLEQGVPVELPQVTVTSLPTATDELVITVNARKEVFLDGVRTTIDKLEPQIVETMKNRKGKDVFLRADKGVDYGFVVQVMAAVRRAGVPGIGMVTEPERVKAP
jgi:biopolymer transport protein TolR